MYFAKDYSNDVPGFGTLDQDGTLHHPGEFTIYKRGKWAGFFAFTIPAGGGQLDYKDGNARTVGLASGVAAGANARLAAAGAPSLFYYDQIDPGEIEVKQSTVYGFTLGASYAVTDAWSLALGTRYSSGVREFDGKATISATNPLNLGGGQLNPSPRASTSKRRPTAGPVSWGSISRRTTSSAPPSPSPRQWIRDGCQIRDPIAPAIGFPDGSNRRIDRDAWVPRAAYRLPQAQVHDKLHRLPRRIRH